MYKKHKSADWAVKHCREDLIALGFVVSNKSKPSANGYDLVAIKNGRGITVEVKMCFYSSRSWRVSKIFNENTDLIAIVFPSGRVLYEDMKTHLSQCSKNKSRSLNLIGRVYE